MWGSVGKSGVVRSPWRCRSVGTSFSPGLVNLQKANWNITIFNGNINYFDWAIFNSKLLVITSYVSGKYSSKPMLTTKLQFHREHDDYPLVI